MKQYILALVLAVVSASVAFAVNSIKEGNMISGHVIVKGTEENIPYATVLIIGSGQGTVSNEEGQFEFRKLPAGKYKLRVSAVGYKTQEKEVTVSKPQGSSGSCKCDEYQIVRDGQLHRPCQDTELPVGLACGE